MSEKNGVEGECEDDELRKEAEGAVGAIELPDIGSATNEELEEFVTKVLRCVASLKSVKIDRAHFLRSELNVVVLRLMRSLRLKRPLSRQGFPLRN